MVGSLSYYGWRGFTSTAYITMDGWRLVLARVHITVDGSGVSSAVHIDMSGWRFSYTFHVTMG